MKLRISLVCGFILVIIAGITFWQIKKASQKAASPSNNKVRQLPKEVTVMLKKDGFSPAVMTIKTGSAVRWKNVSGDKQTVNSDNYPTNQLHKELNFGIFTDGATVVYIFNKPGTYRYHNQFHPEQKGSITVEK
jgi:plastocyanin